MCSSDLLTGEAGQLGEVEEGDEGWSAVGTLEGKLAAGEGWEQGGTLGHRQRVTKLDGTYNHTRDASDSTDTVVQFATELKTLVTL